LAALYLLEDANPARQRHFSGKCRDYLVPRTRIGKDYAISGIKG
jgi:hypothetical protein